uniref:Uncharacterized protein MANES_09G050800 n=1 Tax=Rhizophora mucronata TaxID=61149 RepID=A0A2P2P0L5_RHIMU
MLSACIMEQYEIKSRLDIPSNNFFALSKFPHFAFMSTRAVTT